MPPFSIGAVPAANRARRTDTGPPHHLSPVLFGNAGSSFQCNPVVEQQSPPAIISQFADQSRTVTNTPSSAKFIRISRNDMANQNPAATGLSTASGFVTGKSDNNKRRMPGKNAIAKKNGSAARSSGLMNGRGSF